MLSDFGCFSRQISAGVKQAHWIIRSVWIVGVDQDEYGTIIAASNNVALYL